MLLKHIPTGELYPQTPQLMARVGKDMEQVNDDGSAIVAESPVPADLKVETPKRGKGKAIQIEGEE
jgi:hypothetical protein